MQGKDFSPYLYMLMELQPNLFFLSRSRCIKSTYHCKLKFYQLMNNGSPDQAYHLRTLIPKIVHQMCKLAQAAF